MVVVRFASLFPKAFIYLTHLRRFETSCGAAIRAKLKARLGEP